MRSYTAPPSSLPFVVLLNLIRSTAIQLTVYGTCTDLVAKIAFDRRVTLARPRTYPFSLITSVSFTSTFDGASLAGFRMIRNITRGVRAYRRSGDRGLSRFWLEIHDANEENTLIHGLEGGGKGDF